MAKQRDFLPICFIITVYLIMIETAAESDEVIIDAVGDGEVTSPGFPTSCCSSFTTTIRVNTKPGYLRMTFSDLDLPKGSKLLIYDGESPGKLFEDQPEIRRGTWARPSFAAESGSIHIRFYAPAYGNGTEKSFSGYAGYKASYWVTNSPPEHWHDKAIPDVCKPIVDPMAGERVLQKTIDFGDYHGRTIDCVWQLKEQMADNDAIKQEELQVYLNFTNLDFNGYLDIREGISSEGNEILSVDTFVDSGSLSSIARITSSKGMYIHLTMLNEGRGVVEFVYGLQHSQHDLIEADGGQMACDFGGWGPGFLCTYSDGDLCIPSLHACNGFSNCPDGQDENKALACPESTLAPMTTPVPVIKGNISEPTSGCSSNHIMCRDWSCDLNQPGYCADHGGRMCNSSHPVWCPGNGCIKKRLYGYACERYCGKCSDGTCTLDGKCPGKCTGPRSKRCKNGDCIRSLLTCPGECDDWQHRCKDGSCRSFSSYCPSETCPFGQQRCSYGAGCYSDEDRCDGVDDCPDGTDERNCRSSWHKRKYLWLLSIPLFAMVVMICYRCKHEAERSERRGGLARDESIHIYLPDNRERNANVQRRPNPATNIARSPAIPGSGVETPFIYTPGPAPSEPSHVITPPSVPPGPTAPEPCAPPAYNDVIRDEDAYRRPPADGEPPPPSYNML